MCVRGEQKRSRKELDQAALKQKQRMVDVPYELSRYVPPLKDIVEVSPPSIVFVQKRGE